ncbi:MAG: hypothetical protein ACTS5I_09555, partial [Rhodanobacter sp.]
LAELRGVMTPVQQARWVQIKADFLRNKAMGGEESDVGGRMVAQLADIAGNLQALKPSSAAATEAPSSDMDAETLQAPMFEILRATLARQNLLNEALIDLSDRLAQAPSGQGAPTESASDNDKRQAKSRNAREIVFGRALAELRFLSEQAEAAGPKPDNAAKLGKSARTGKSEKFDKPDPSDADPAA